MSSTLFLSPNPVLMKTRLSDKLKFVLQKRFNIGKGFSLTHDDCAYLSGLRDAGVDDAQVIIEAINKHGCVSIKEEF